MIKKGTPQRHKCVSALLLILFLSSCGPFFCSIGTFVNNSDHRISVLTYEGGQIVLKESVVEPLLPGGRHELEARNCENGSALLPFGHLLRDSLAIIFNDTLRVLLYSADTVSTLFRERTPLWGRGWTEVYADYRYCIKYFEYEFTNWHFEQAVEYLRN